MTPVELFSHEFIDIILIVNFFHGYISLSACKRHKELVNESSAEDLVALEVRGAGRLHAEIPKPLGLFTDFLRVFRLSIISISD